MSSYCRQILQLLQTNIAATADILLEVIYQQGKKREPDATGPKRIFFDASKTKFTKERKNT
jgi:hypothetical protein